MKWMSSKCKYRFLRSFLFLVQIVFFLSLSAQNEICQDGPSSSVKKLYDKGKNYKKYDYKHRVKYFKDAWELDEEGIPCMWELAKMSFRRR